MLARFIAKSQATAKAAIPTKENDGAAFRFPAAGNKFGTRINEDAETFNKPAATDEHAAAIDHSCDTESSMDFRAGGAFERNATLAGEVDQSKGQWMGRMLLGRREELKDLFVGGKNC